MDHSKVVISPTHRIDDDDESDDNNDDTFGGRISHGDNLLSSIVSCAQPSSFRCSSFILKASYIRFTFIYDRIYRLCNPSTSNTSIVTRKASDVRFSLTSAPASSMTPLGRTCPDTGVGECGS
jgi:hypothetical protein